MKLIIPMAGKGTRLRPHSHTTPKPLLPVAGTTIIERIVQTFSRTIDRTVDEIVFILGDFGDDVKRDLTQMSERQGAKASFYRQDIARGTAHAVFCAAEKLEGEVIIVFADTLFDTKTRVSVDGADSVIWLKEVEDPSRFGVAVQTEGRITGFVEKPKDFISNLAIIGVYYFRSGEALREKIQYLIDHNVTGHGSEYQLTDAIDALLKDGKVFRSATVDEWLDCGTVPEWIKTSGTIVAKENQEVNPSDYPGSTIIRPVYIGPGAEIIGSTVGPNASIGAGARIVNSSVADSIVLDRAHVSGCDLNEASIGFVAVSTCVKGAAQLGSHSVLKA